MSPVPHVQQRIGAVAEARVVWIGAAHDRVGSLPGSGAIKSNATSGNRARCREMDSRCSLLRGLRPKQTDLVPDKGQFRSRFPPSAQLLLSGNDFSGSAQPTRHHLSATLLDGRAGAAGPDNAGYEPHPSCGDCPLTGSEPAKKTGQHIPKKSLPDNNSWPDSGNASGTALYRGPGQSV